MISGIDYAEIITKMIELERRPIDSAQEKIEISRLKQEAYDEINRMALSVKLSMFDLSSASTFNKRTVNTSNEAIATGSATAKAALGSTSFKVAQLASGEHNVSSGVDDYDTTTIGAGTLIFESASRRIDKATDLDSLNGGDGVQRGRILISNGSDVKEFDLSLAVTVEDVLDILNDNNLDFQVDIAANIDPTDSDFTGYRLAIESSSALTLSNVAGGSVVQDLGLSGVNGTAGNQLGSNIYYISESTMLSQINDNHGIETNASGTNDMRFYVKKPDGNKSAVEVDLSNLETVGQTISAINSAIFDAGLSMFAKAKLNSAGNAITFSGTVTGIQDINDSKAATGLGLVNSDGLIGEMNSVFIRNLQGGNGIEGLDGGIFRVTTTNEDEYYINLSGSNTVGDIIRSINSAVDTVNGNSNLVATVNNAGNGIDIRDNSGGTSTALRIENIYGDVARQLGINTDLLVSGVQMNIESDSKMKSVVMLSDNDLKGIDGNSLIGRLVQHQYSSRLIADPNSNLGKRGYENAVISAFVEAGDPESVSADQAVNAIFTAGAQDTLADTINLDDFDEDMLPGAKLTISDGTSTYSAIIESYDSATETVTFTDNTLSTAGITTADFTSNGYQVEYMNRLVLSSPDPTTVADSINITAAIGGNTITDAEPAAGHYDALDLTRMVGASVSWTDSNGTVHSRTVTAIDPVAQTFDVDGAVLTAQDQAGMQTYGYTVYYNPIENAGLGNSDFLSQHNNALGGTDKIMILGVSGKTVKGQNLENKAISRHTRLDNLGGAEGVQKGIFRIMSAEGNTSSEYDLDLSSIQTIGDVIDYFDEVTSYRIEINHTGDGLRVYDISNTPSEGISISDVSGYSMASDLNIEQTLSTKAIKYEQNLVGGDNGNFVSLYIADDGTSGTHDSVVSTDLVGLSPEDLYGAIVTYVDANNANRRIYAMVSDYNSATGTISLKEHAYQGTNAAVAANSAANQNIEIVYQRHMEAAKTIGTVNAGGTYTPSSGVGSNLVIDLDSDKYSAEELIGSLLTVNSSGDFSQVGQTAMITDVSFAPGNASRATVEYVSIDNFDPLAGDSIAISRNSDVTRNVRRNVDEEKSFMNGLADAGFISFTATVEEQVSTTKIKSDEFVNLDPDKIIGALITVTSATDDDREGDYAVITDYDPTSNTITVDSWTDINSTGDTMSLSANSKLAVTYKSELEGAVLRTNSSSIASVSLVNSAGTPAPSSRYVVVENLSTIPAVPINMDALIGSTVTFNSTATNGLANETRTIVDVVEGYSNNSGMTMFVFDADLPAVPTNADQFSITMPELKGTVREVDFSQGILSTYESMSGGVGDRDFYLTPVIDGSFQKELEITSTDTLSDVVSKINDLDVGVSASAYQDGSSTSPYRLSVISDNSGEAGAVTVMSNIYGFNFSQISQGKDAKVILGGDTGTGSVITSASNTISGAIEGLTMNLKKVSSETVSLSVGHDTEGIVDIADEFNTAYNELLKSLNKLTAHETQVEVEDEEGNVTYEKQRGLLFGDPTAIAMIDQLKNLIYTQVEGVPTGAYQFLSDVGFDFDNSGNNLEFDKDAFTAALQSHFSQVKDLFSYTPSLTKSSSASISSEMLQDDYKLSHILNGKTSASGWSENGNGTNGIKIKTGDNNKYLSIATGEEKTLYGMRLHHLMPDTLTAERVISTSAAASATVDNTVTDMDDDNATDSYIQDTANLVESEQLIKDELIGAELVVGNKTSTILDYDEDNNRLYFSGTSITTADITTYGYTIRTPSGSYLDEPSLNFDLEYLDSYTGEYRLYRSFRDMSRDELFVVFPGGLKTSSMRLKYLDNTSPSEDFSEEGYRARILEWELLDAQGVGSSFNRTLEQMTNAQTGSIKQAYSYHNDIIDNLNSQVSRLTERIEQTQTNMIRQFQSLETTISSLSAQSEYFTNTLKSMPSAFSFRNGGGSK